MKKLSLLLMIPLLLSGCNKTMSEEEVLYNILTNLMEKYDDVDKYEISMTYKGEEDYIVQFDDNNNYYHEEYKVKGVSKESNYVFYQNGTIYSLDETKKKGKSSNYLDKWINTRNECNLLLSTVIASELECLNYVKLYFEGNDDNNDIEFEIIDNSSIDVTINYLNQEIDISIKDYLVTNLKYNILQNGVNTNADIKINYDYDVVIPNIDDYDFSLDVPYIPF